MAKIGINIATGSLQQNEIVVGIDLGTTNSLIAIVHPETKQAVTLKEHDGSSLTPSVVYFEPSGSLVIGDAAKEFLITSPERTVFSAKRLLGKSYNEIKNDVAALPFRIKADDSEKPVSIEIGSASYNPVEISSIILKELKKKAEHILKTPVNKAVITVPAYFNDGQRQATTEAGRIAGIEVLRIINEPTAASLAYGLGLSKEEEKTIAVYDLGGGTFDVSFLRLSGGVF